MTETQVEQIESASALRRGIEVWFAVFGGVALWMVHLVFEASAEHWAHIEHQWSWTLNAVTAVTAVGTIVATALAWRMYAAARDADESDKDDAGQLKFLGQLGLLFGVINLALILLEGSYVWLLPHS